MGTLKPGSALAFQQLSSRAVPHFLQPVMVWCMELREEHSRGARKGCTPRRLLFFLAFISPMTMRKEEPDIACSPRSVARAERS